MKFFSSVWPTAVVLLAGIVMFIFGNFFGNYLPETWPEPLAWCSSMTLCVGLVLAAIAYELNQTPRLVCAAAGAILGVVCLFLIFILLSIFNLVDYGFFDLEIFKFPSFGALGVCFSLLAVGIFLESWKNKNNTLQFIYSLLGSLAILCLGIIVLGVFNMLPLTDTMFNVLCYTIGGCFLADMAIILIALVCRKFHRL